MGRPVPAKPPLHLPLLISFSGLFLLKVGGEKVWRWLGTNAMKEISTREDITKFEISDFVNHCELVEDIF